MRANDLSLLPDDLSRQSISAREIVLPYAEALAAIEHLYNSGHHVLGWEGWLKSPGGDLTHSEIEQGTVSLEHLSPREAADLCIKTIESAQRGWPGGPEAERGELYFCIAVGPA